MQYEVITNVPINNCPCCSGKATLLSDSIPFDPANVVPTAFWIRCDNCRMQTKYMSSPKAVIDVWNKRSNGSDCSPSVKKAPQDCDINIIKRPLKHCTGNCCGVNVPRSTRKAMIRLSHEAYRLFLRKNADYGDSISVCGLSGVVVRLLDKLSRAAVVSQNSIQVKDETLRDTLLDISNYALMGVRLIDQGKTENKESAPVNNSSSNNDTSKSTEAIH